MSVEGALVTAEARAEAWRKTAIQNRAEADNRRISVDDQSARVEAGKRYDGDTIVNEEGETVSFDDWGYAEQARAAFMAGVAWAREVSNG